MKLKSTIYLFIFFLTLSIAKAQQSGNSVYAYFNNPTTDSYSCGGHSIIGELSAYYYNYDETGNGQSTEIVLMDDNQLFLEIADINSNNFSKIPVNKIDIGNYRKGLFKLPDSLKVGKQYLIRMSTTNPALISNITTITFGAGVVPYSVNFNQEFDFYTIPSNVYLNVNIKIKNGKDSIQNQFYQKYFVKLSDGTKKEFSAYYMPSYATIQVLAKDTVNVYKITEIVNSCGVKGEISGEAKAKKKQYLDLIFIKSSFPEDSYNICSGSKVSIDVNSKSLPPKSKLKVQVSKDYYFSTLLGEFDAVLDENNRLVFDIPKYLKENEQFTIRVYSSEKNLMSNSMSYYVMPVLNTMSYYYSYSKADNINIYFYAYNPETNQSSTLPIRELEINGKKIDKSEIDYSTINIKLTQKDTVLTINKITNTCGNLAILNPTITFKPSNFRYLTFKTDNKPVCQGSTIDLPFEINNTARINEIKFETYISATGREYSEETKSYSGKTAYTTIYNIKYSYNSEKKNVSVTIPDNLLELLNKQFSNRKVNIQELYFSMYGYSNTSTLSISSNYFHIPVKLAPILKLTSPSIEVLGKGNVKIPVQFIGGDKISYALSNGLKGNIDQKNYDCYYCEPLSSGEDSINVLVEKNSTFRIVSAENDCAVAAISGETKVIVNNPDLQKIEIDASIGQKACSNSTFEIPFNKYGTWNNQKIYAYVTVYDYNKNSTQYKYEVTTSPFKYKVPNVSSYRQFTVRFETEKSEIKTKVYSFSIVYFPNNVNFSTSYYSIDYKDGVELIKLVENTSSQNINFNFYGYGGDLDFKVNGINQEYSYSDGNYSSLSSSFTFKKDTTIILNSVSNSCGTLEINRKFVISTTPTVIKNIYESSYQNFLPTSSCAGSKRYIHYEYAGKIPKNDSVIVQIAGYKGEISSPSKLVFFDIPTKQGINELLVTIPDTCFGSYAFRVRSAVTSSVSYYNYGLHFEQKPIIKLTSKSGATELLNTEGVYLYLQSNLEKSQSYNLVMNDGSTYSNYDFGQYFSSDYNDSTQKYTQVIRNYGKFFNPKQTITYSIASVYNYCGIGKAEGSIKVIVNPKINPSINNELSSSTFCASDSLKLNLSYFGEFPKDTLMGIYLHTNAKAAYNQELATFKNNPSEISVKLPKEVYSGYYFIQIRKKSRSKIYYSGNSRPDSLSRIDMSKNWDSEYLYFNIATPPNINLSGSTEIFVGNSAKLNINPINNLGQDISVSKDTISFIYGMPYFFEFNNGSKYTSTNASIVVNPSKTTTYTISSVKNYCGVGKPSGSATITVLPKSDKRIESLGFLRKADYQEKEVIYYYYYDSYTEYCAGKSDSLDIKVYGVTKDSDFSKYKVLLSDKDGQNYSPIKTTKSVLVVDSLAYKIVRLWHELPEDLKFGYSYRIKGVSDDEGILSTPIIHPLKIHELPTATLTGNATFLTGEKVSATVKYTGDLPWLTSVVDNDGTLVYNGLPSKSDSTENFKNFQPKLIYTNELKLELAPQKTNTYKVSKVYNMTCGSGKIMQGEFSVDLILANENLSQNLIQIYPNPTVNQLNIDLSTLNATTTIDLFDLNGRLLSSKIIDKSEVHQKQNWDFSQYHTGTYLLKISSYKFLQTYRVMKY